MSDWQAINSEITQNDVGFVDKAKDMFSNILDFAQGIGTSYMEFKTWEQQMEENDSVLEKSTTTYSKDQLLNGQSPTTNQMNSFAYQWEQFPTIGKYILVGGGLFLAYNHFIKG